MFNDPLSLIYPLCADAAFSQINPLSDYVWNLTLAGGEPPALNLHTTFGLRCLGMRLFPSFSQRDNDLIDPHSFAQPPQLIERFPAYARIAFRPFSSIDVELEYWVPNSNLICGRVKITNLGFSPATMRMNWNSILQPGHKGTPMDTIEMGVNTVMQGACEDVYPVFFVTGGPENTSRIYPSLGFSFALAENASRRLSWGLAALDSPENSFVQARHATSLNWDTEVTRMEMEEKRKRIEFSSKENDWGMWLGETQVHARQFLVNGLNQEKSIHLVSRRDPDTRLQDTKLLRRNSSLAGEANLYQIWLLSRVLMPTNPGLIKDLIQTVLERQQPNGALPFTVSPGGTVSTVKAPPLLASLIVEVDSFLHDQTWLKQTYPNLIRAFRCWFDASGEKLPVWESPLQTALEFSPIISTWQETDQGLDVSTIFSPGLIAILYKEGQALMQLAIRLNSDEDVKWLKMTCEQLSSAIERSYDPNKKSYRYRDIVSWRCDPAQSIKEIKHNGLVLLNRNFRVPRRLLITCSSPRSELKEVQLILRGTNENSSVSELITMKLLYQQSGLTRCTSKNLFTTLESIDISGLPKEAVISIKLAGTDSEDLSLFLPLWAGLVSADNAREIIENNLLPRYSSPYGFSSFPRDEINSVDSKKNSVIPLWNALIIESLLQYGYREAAANVLTQHLKTIFSEWQHNGYTNSSYRVADGKGCGDHNGLDGLVPIWPLLKLLGIEFLSNKELIIREFNDLFPPFTVQYERVMLILQKHSTVIQTISGSRTEIEQAGNYKILLP